MSLSDVGRVCGGRDAKLGTRTATVRFANLLHEVGSKVGRLAPACVPINAGWTLATPHGAIVLVPLLHIQHPN